MTVFPLQCSKPNAPHLTISQINLYKFMKALSHFITTKAPLVTSIAPPLVEFP